MAKKKRPVRSKRVAKKAHQPIDESGTAASTAHAGYPRHSLERALRIPRAMLDQNAGKECSEAETAGFLGVSYNKGPYALEISSAKKFGLLRRPKAGRAELTELAKKILRPQDPKDELEGLRQAVLNAPDISQIYEHYRGENLPDSKFFDNALVDKFGLPQEKLGEFRQIFIETLKTAKLIEEHAGKQRLLDVAPIGDTDRIKRLGKTVSVGSGDSCFVMQPFAPPLGDYYEKIYKPAIEKAGLRPMRADDDIFATGKVIDQIWSGLTQAKVLVAELTSRNPNVFYELGLAHALRKPVVLVSSKEDDVPFDLQHIRVIYYDVADPFWGQKLIEKVAENVLSALRNPEEAIFPVFDPKMSSGGTAV